MRSVAQQRRQDHDISFYGSAALALLAALTVAPSPSATAQTAVPCTAITNDAERLACYDRALRAAPAPAPAPAATPPPAATAPTSSTPRAAAPATPTAAPATPAAPAAATAEPRSERRVRQSAARVAPQAPVARSAPTAGGNDEQEEITAIVIVGLRALPGRETTFTAEDGTTWVQTDSQRLAGLPDTPFNAEIKRGAIGSYFLVAQDRTRAIRVRPVR